MYMTAEIQKIGERIMVFCELSNSQLYGENSEPIIVFQEVSGQLFMHEAVLGDLENLQPEN